jgi:hypothetical protein
MKNALMRLGLFLGIVGAPKEKKHAAPKVKKVAAKKHAAPKAKK